MFAAKHKGQDAADLVPIKGWPGYFVTKAGAVYSAKYGNPRRMSTNAKAGLYPKVTLCCVDRRVSVNVHTIVAETFIGPRPSGQVVRHLDGNPSNNRLSNLKYGTCEDNERDKLRHGRRPVGSAVFGAKLSDSDVLAIRALFLEGHGAVGIASRYGINLATAKRVIHGHTWGHLPVPDYSSRRPKVRPGSWNVGEKSGMAKLTEESARRAVAMLAEGRSRRSIASELGVTPSSIGKIAIGETWRHIPRPCAISGKRAVTWRAVPEQMELAA